MSFPTATAGIRTLEQLGIVREVTGRERDRVYTYAEYLALLNEGTELPPPAPGAPRPEPAALGV